MKRRPIAYVGQAAPEIEARWLSSLLDAVHLFERAEWKWSPETRRAMAAIVLNPTFWRTLDARQRDDALAELRKTGKDLAAIADGRQVPIEIRSATFYTVFHHGDVHGQWWTLDERPTSFASRVVRCLSVVAVRRCPWCRRVFAAVRGRGKPQQYCPRGCAQTARTRRWRDANRDAYLANRRAAYRRRRERELGRKVRIQARRRVTFKRPATAKETTKERTTV